MKLIGIVLLVLAAVLVGWFGFGTPLGAVVFQIHPPFLNTLQAGVQRNLSPWLWNDVIQPVLEWPSWILPLVIGALLLVLAPGRRKDA